MSEFVPTLTPGENYWDRIAGRDPAAHADQGDDFTTLLPHPTGEVPPALVFTDGMPVQPPKQTHRVARAVLPVSNTEAEVRAISHSAILVLDAVERLDELAGDPEVDHGTADDILLEFVPDEVKAAYVRGKERIGFWYA